uniref:Kelch domain containing 2 n=1 Tax=Podarcis muralis TaxID=64176 RepID=A0A670HL41_PODMU
MADDNEELPVDEDLPEDEDLPADEEIPGPAEDSLEHLENGSPAERSGHVAVSDGQCMFVWGGYKNAQVRGFYDFYLPRDEIWIYNMETGRWTKHRTAGDVPPSMSGSCAVCMDRVLYLFGGHHARGNTNKFYMLNSRSSDKVLQWVRVECQGTPPSSKDKLGVWVYRNKLIFFGGYGYYPEGEQIGRFEFDETSFWGKSPSPRAAHACATVGNRGYVFGGRYRESRMNDLYSLNLDKWEWHEIITQGICPVGRSWHSLTPVSSDHLFLFGGFTTDKQPLNFLPALDHMELGWHLDMMCIGLWPSAGNKLHLLSRALASAGDAWIYCISKNEWIQFEHNYSEKPRLWHTACASDEGEVIVFGGCANNLLAHHKAAHSNEILVFSLQPKSLVRLCLEAIMCFKEILANSWHCLPKHLLHSLNQRFGSNNTCGS